MVARNRFVHATDCDHVRRLVEASSPGELAASVEPLAAEVVRMMRVDTQRALEYADRATLVAAATGDERLAARATWSRGHALSGVLRTRESADCYESAADAYRQLGESLLAARVSIGWVNTLMYLGEYPRALEVGESARRVLSRSGELGACARLDMNLGNIHFRVERPRDALSKYNRALRVARRLDDALMITIIQFNRANALTNLGRLDAAEALYRDVHKVALAEGETRTVGFVDYSLAYLQLLRGDYGRAYRSFDDARIVFEELEDIHYLTLTHADLAELFIEMNAFRRAKEAARRARTLAERHDIRFEASRSALLQGIASMGLGELGQAEAFLEDARRGFRGEGNEASSSLGAVYVAELETRRGQTDRAAARLEQAADTFAGERLRLREATATLRLATVELGRGRVEQSGEAVARARRALRRARSPWLLARADHLSGRIALGSGDTVAAVRHLKRAVHGIETIRGRIGIDEFRISFTEDKAPVYADLVHALLQRGGPHSVADAFEVVERSRSRALVDLLSGRLAEAKASADDRTEGLLTRLEKLRGEVSWLSGFDPGAENQRGRRNESRLRRLAPEVRAREAEMADLVQRIQNRDGALGAITCGETSTLKDVRGDLEPETTLVEYYVSRHGAIAFVVDRAGARVVDLHLEEADIVRDLTTLRFHLEKWGYGDEYVRARGASLRSSLDHVLVRLREQLWDPLDVQTDRVVVVPHGPLHSLPFPALADRNGGHLVDRHTISILPSASARRYLGRAEPARGQRRAQDARVLSVGVGDASIPHVDREVAQVRSEFRHGRLLRGARATRKRFQAEAPSADVIHLATHGIFREDDPHFSALRLADGWMSLYDFYGMKLQADLVCVSACQSGRSWTGGGDELVGLARGFLYAGASSLVVSLWPVQDESTALLMQTFYRELKAGQPAEHALRNAMQATRLEWPHPYHWAPFVLMGRGGPIGAAPGAAATEPRPLTPSRKRTRQSGRKIG